MTDTQWARFIVFLQAQADEAHQYSGSVHAPDAELALMNARDVFVRRPECVSLWVVRADQIFSKTMEELALDSTWLEQLADTHQPNERYYVCLKLSHKGLSTHVGEVEAPSPSHALKAALAQFTDQQALVWWVFPAQAVTHSNPDDIASLFAPAHDKTEFRDQAEFHTVATMKQIKGRSRES